MTLARAGDPYINGAGQRIEPTDVATTDLFDVDERRKIMPRFRDLSITKRTNLENMPEPDGRQQSVIAAVVSLRMLGVLDTEIAEMMNTTIDQIQSIVKLPATQVTFERIYQNIIHANAENVQGRIAAYAGEAVDTVVDMMKDTDTRDDVRLKAAQDILDRSGTNADQFFGDVGQKQHHDDELRIIVMDEEGQKERVRVDIGRKR